MDDDEHRPASGKIVAFPSAPESTTAPAAVDRAIGAAIRRRRLALDLTHDGLAQAIGVSVDRMRLYELGAIKLSSKDIISLAAGLKFSVTTLLELAEKFSDEPLS